MKNVKVIFIALIAFVAIAGLNSCNKTDDSVTVPEITKTTITDYANIVSSFALDSEDEVVSSEESDLKSASLTSCFTVTVDQNVNGAFYPRVWTVDYLGGCTFFSGNTKTGKIHVSLTDFWKNVGSLKTVTYEDYYFNGNKLAGVTTILNTGLNERGNLTFTKTVNDASLTYPDGTFISWECDKQSELISGGSTFLFADDVYSVTGTVTGVNLDLTNYTLTITSPLIYKNGCFYPVSGIVTIVTVGGDLQTIDYGTGECDNLATLTVGGVTTEINL